MHQIQGEDLDTADDSREGTDYCSTNGKPTDTEQQVLEKERKGEEYMAWEGQTPHIRALGNPRKGDEGENQDDSVGERGWGGCIHLEGPSGFITGGVKGNFQFLAPLWTGSV